MAEFSGKVFPNQRKEPRKPYSGSISFVYKKNLYPGELVNYSQSGLFLKSGLFFDKGEVITVTLPASKYKVQRQKGRIVWCNTEGCGVQLLG
jgi:hypothetical protein